MKGLEMVTFREANQARISLKMSMSNYSWFRGMAVESDNGRYYITINTTHLNDLIKNIIPSFHKGIQVKIDPEN